MALTAQHKAGEEKKDSRQKGKKTDLQQRFKPTHSQMHHVNCGCPDYAGILSNKDDFGSLEECCFISFPMFTLVLKLVLNKKLYHARQITMHMAV